jgi:integrase/recombinase XerD
MMTTDRGLRSLAVEHWPVAFQEAWATAQDEGDLLEPDGPAAHWRQHTCLKTRKGFGFFLAWVIHHEGALAQPIAALVVPDRVLAYVADLQANRSSSTVTNRVQELYDALRVMEPAFDWRWLKQIYKALRARTQPVSAKAARLRSATELEALGLRLMREADEADAWSARRRAIHYRDGLSIALLLRRPLRTGNFHALQLGEHIQVNSGSWHLILGASEHKGKRPFEAQLSASIIVALTRYIELHRPVLLARGTANHAPHRGPLWISEKGRAMAEITLHNRIRLHTERAFGSPIPPHWFRDAAATAVVLEAPREAMLTMHLLGHAKPDIAEQHYNRAQTVDSSRRHAALMAHLMAVIEDED